MTYLDLDGSNGAILTPHDLPQMNKNSSFTFGVWLKFTDTHSFQTIFSIHDNFVCQLQNGRLSCGESSEFNRVLSVSLQDVKPLTWVYLSFASEMKVKRKDGTSNRSYLQLTTNDGDTIDSVFLSDVGIPFSQYSWNWKACVGNCDEGLKPQGFIGGVRSLLLIGEYVDMERSHLMKNYRLNWNPKILLDYRFAPDTFLDDSIWY
jgi:hypothetical protein